MATIVLKLRGRELSRHPITSRITRIGRDVTNDVAIDNPGVSRVHASIRFTAGKFHVVDEGSANGIFVNGTEIDMHELNYGDEIQFGKFTAVFLAGGGAATQNLDDGATRGDVTVNPVETTSISTADLRQMIAKRTASSPPQRAVPPPQPSDSRFETHSGSPLPGSFTPPTPPSQTNTQQLMALAIGALGATVVALGGLLVFLLMRD